MSAWPQLVPFGTLESVKTKAIFKELHYQSIASVAMVAQMYQLAVAPHAGKAGERPRVFPAHTHRDAWHGGSQTADGSAAL